MAPLLERVSRTLCEICIPKVFIVSSSVLTAPGTCWLRQTISVFAARVWKSVIPSCQSTEMNQLREKMQNFLNQCENYVTNEEKSDKIVYKHKCIYVRPVSAQ
jgi:hypothetical protein